MPDIRLSVAARDDLMDIWRDTAERWGPDQADRYLDEIDTALKALARNPRRGAECPDLLPGARRQVTGRHLVFYEEDATRIMVIRVLHQSMDLPRHLGRA